MSRSTPAVSTNTPLDSIPVSILKGAGKQTVERLEKLGISSVQDLLFHLPVRYENRTQVYPISALAIGQHALIDVCVESVQSINRQRSSLLCRVYDDSGTLNLRFFNYAFRQRSLLKPSTLLRCFGEVRSGYYSLEMIHPEYQIISDTERGQVASSYTPVYPLTQGIHQNTLRRLIEQVITLINNDDSDLYSLSQLLPETILNLYKFPKLKDALTTVHAPSNASDIELLEQGDHLARRCLAFEELLAHHLCLGQARYAVNKQKSARILESDIVDKFIGSLTFDLTSAQKRAILEVKHDFGKTKPMTRLLQGDVGSGKTIVAAAAALLMASCQYQTALMAPTELLAEQHFRNFCHWFEPLGVHVVYLSGKLNKNKRDEKLEVIENGSAAVVIGTHALFQDDIEFFRLGLIIVDEQHRFGVHQRLAFRQKGLRGKFCPHQLVMTATPIPRTLAMLRFADLDISVIDEMPPGRTAVKTSVIADHRRNEVIERIRHWVKTGRQVYWVCTSIDESEVIEVEAAEKTLDLLERAFPELTVKLLHGRMKAPEKEEIMTAFQTGQIDLLVATTVIEVGVDVTNAGLMIIENAERLGLFQLHQLRGRVGRGTDKSYCVLMYRPPLSQIAQQRLSIIRTTNDGFEIAEKDLDLRGPGEVLGTRQTGQLKMRIANLIKDRDLISNVREAAEIMQLDHPGNIQPLIDRWIIDSGRYADV